jgi:hypothetical protein
VLVALPNLHIVPDAGTVSFTPRVRRVPELRELMPTRRQLGRQQSSHIQRLQKTLEGANIKLDSVITDIVGKSGRAMIQALIAGETIRSSWRPWRIGASRLHPRNCARRFAAG